MTAPLRLFASASDAPRARRPSDGVRLGASLVGLTALLASHTSAPGPFDTAVADLISTASPGILSPLWSAAFALVLVWPLLLVIVALLVRHRLRVARDLLAAGALAIVGAATASRLATGAWPDDLIDLWRASGPPVPPALRVAIGVAIAVAAAPHLGRPIRHLSIGILALGSMGAVFLQVSRPSDVAAALLVGSACGSLVLLIFGSPRGYPRPEVVRAALAELGVQATDVRAAQFQPGGAYRVDADDAEGPLWVEVFGRDARDAAAVSRIWTSLWFRGGWRDITIGRQQQVEHEAMVTLLAERGGADVPRVVAAGGTEAGDALLVVRPNGVPLHEARTALSPTAAQALVAGYWTLLERLHAAGITHGSLDDRELGVTASGEPCFVGLSTAGIPARRPRVAADQAQLLATSADLLGAEAAVAVARGSIGLEGLRSLQPYLQPAVLTSRGRRRDRSDLLEELRDATAAATGTEAPALKQIRRFTWGSLLQVVLLIVAAYAVVVGISGMDLETVADEFATASWGVVFFALIVAQVVRVPAGYSTLGASPDPIPLGPTVMLQYAISYINLAVPSTAARIAINIRYFQKLGVDHVRAVTIGGLDSVAGFFVQISLIVVIALSGATTLERDQIDLSSVDLSGALTFILVVALVGGVIFAVITLSKPQSRAWIRERYQDAVGTLQVLRQPRKVAQLLGGNLVAQLLSAAVISLCVTALGGHVSFIDIVMVNTLVSLFAGLMPVPGGIGVTEAALTVGLTAAGLPEETAFAAALLTRLLTFYFPPIWGFFALRWLQHHDFL